MGFTEPARAVGFALIASLLVAAAPACATDYFTLDLRSAEFSPQPLGPPAQFQSGATVALRSVATESEAAAPSSPQALAAPAHRVSTAQIHRGGVPVHVARRADRNPLNAFASYRGPKVPGCSSGGVCVWDGRLDRWRAP